jgi:UDP-glucuronate decarboxylase
MCSARSRLTETKSELRIGALPYRPTEIWRMRGDNTRAKELLGWQPNTSLEDGLRKTIEWFRGQRVYEDAGPGGARMGST